MSYSSWLRLLARIFKIDRTRRVPDPYRPRFDQLEDRVVPAITLTGQTAAFIEGNSSTSALVATFTDNTPAIPQPSTDYTATVDWGDGTTTAGVVSFDSGTQKYLVNASHGYADETPAGSPITFTVAVTETTDDNDTATGTGSANVADAALGAGSIVLAATEDSALTDAPVATFTDDNTQATTADFTATIDWGDGTTTAATSFTGS